MLVYFSLQHFSVLCNYLFPLYPSNFFFDIVITDILIYFSLDIQPSFSSLWVILPTLKIVYLIIACFFHFRFNRFLAIVRRQVCRPAVFTMRPERNTYFPRAGY